MAQGHAAKPQGGTRHINPVEKPAAARAQGEDITSKHCGIATEVARNYGEQWTFKGQMLTVKTAVRIPYRFTVTDQ